MNLYVCRCCALCLKFKYGIIYSICGRIRCLKKNIQLLITVRFTASSVGDWLYPWSYYYIIVHMWCVCIRISPTQPSTIRTSPTCTVRTPTKDVYRHTLRSNVVPHQFMGTSGSLESRKLDTNQGELCGRPDHNMYVSDTWDPPKNLSIEKPLLTKLLPHIHAAQCRFNANVTPRHWCRSEWGDWTSRQCRFNVDLATEKHTPSIACVRMSRLEIKTTLCKVP